MPWTARDLVFTIICSRPTRRSCYCPPICKPGSPRLWPWTSGRRASHCGIQSKISVFVFHRLFRQWGPHSPRAHLERPRPQDFQKPRPSTGLAGGQRALSPSDCRSEQRVWDLRQGWWAVGLGFQRLPKVERIIYLPFGNEAKWSQQLLANEIDRAWTCAPSISRPSSRQNPNISTWTGREAPYGYLDWWPLSLGFNNLEEPFSDPEIRWAVNYAINRAQVVDVGWQGAGKFTLHPYPEFPPLMRYIDQIQDLFAQYQLNTYDPARTAEIMERKGWHKDEDGFWSKDGTRLKMVVDVFPNLFQDFTPVLIEQLRQAGFDASFRATNDAYTRMTQGTARAFVMGHAASVRDPYFTLRLYHSRFVQPTGTAAEYSGVGKNEEFDAIVDRMAEVAPDDPELVALFRRAMDIWLRELPSIPLIQWYHRIPHNELIGKTGPTAENPYVNSAYWHRTWLLVLLNLEPAQ